MNPHMQSEVGSESCEEGGGTHEDRGPRNSLQARRPRQLDRRARKCLESPALGSRALLAGLDPFRDLARGAGGVARVERGRVAPPALRVSIERVVVALQQHLDELLLAPR